MARVHNFNAGPAGLPLPALERAQRELLDFEGTGMSIMEHSHRGKAYEAVHNEAIALVQRAALGPRGLPRALPAGRRQPAVRDGADEPPAHRQERRLHRSPAPGRRRPTRRPGASARCASPPPPRSTRRTRGSRARTSSHLDPNAAYVHITTNNTIFGTQWHHVPDVGERPARRRHVARHLWKPLRRLQVRADLRRRAEEHRALGRGRGHRQEDLVDGAARTSRPSSATRRTPRTTRSTTRRPPSRST